VTKREKDDENWKIQQKDEIQILSRNAVILSHLSQMRVW